MKIQNHVKINYINSHTAVNFTSTKFAESFAEQVQKASREIYHHAHIDGKDGKRRDAHTPFTQKIVDRVTLYAQMDGCRDTKTLVQKVRAKIDELYNLAFADSQNGTQCGWVQATTVRRQIADLLDSDGFKQAATKLRENVIDNLKGGY